MAQSGKWTKHGRWHLPLTLILALSLSACAQTPSKDKKDKEVQPATAQSQPLNKSCIRRSESRIVGGQSASIDNWPGMAVLRIKSKTGDLRYFCGATAIAPTAVLTAAHCVTRWQKNASGKWEIPNSGIVEVVLGTGDIHSVPNDKVRQVADRVVHEGWTGQAKVGNDLALVLLETKWEGPVSPLVSLPDLDSATHAYAAGFGMTVDAAAFSLGASWDSATGKGKAGSPILQEVLMPMVVPGECRRAYPTLNEQLQVCAGYDVGGKDSCYGDSGGPLVTMDANRCLAQIGIVSYGDGCARRMAYGVYTRVSHYTGWIRAHIPGTSFSEANSRPEPANVASSQALDTLISRLKPVEQVLDVQILPSKKLHLGQTISFEIKSKVEGNPLVIDENARGQIVQIYPNRYAPAASATKLAAGSILRLPEPGARYSFKANPPEGKGRLLALIVPNTVSLDRNVAGAPVKERGIVVEEAPASYAMNVAQQLINAIDDGGGKLTGWGLAVVNYSIQP